MKLSMQQSRYKRQDNGVLDVHIMAADSLAAVERMLGDLKGKAPATLRDAVNAAAKQMRTQLAEEAQKTYVSKKLKYKKEIKIRKANLSNPTARLQISGERTGLTKHQVSPPRRAQGKRRPKRYRARVLRSSSLTEMRQDDLKAFLVQFASGHRALVQRVPGEEYSPKGAGRRAQKYGRNADMTRIVEKKTLSVAEMLASPQVYGIVAARSGDLLQREIARFVRKTIAKGARK